MDDVIILGAGIVGVATGIHLLRRGRSVTLIDKNQPGRETSFGNAGIIQREGVRPHAFPRDLHTLMQVGLHLSTAARYEPLALPRLLNTVRLADVASTVRYGFTGRLGSWPGRPGSGFQTFVGSASRCR